MKNCPVSLKKYCAQYSSLLWKILVRSSKIRLELILNTFVLSVITKRGCSYKVSFSKKTWYLPRRIKVKVVGMKYFAFIGRVGNIISRNSYDYRRVSTMNPVHARTVT